MTDRHLFALSDDGVPSDSIILADGSLWSHAVTPGDYVKGQRFTLDQTAIESFVRNFATGGRKLPVDYEHSSVSDEYASARAAGEAPKAGDIVELRGVFSAADFSGDLKTAAEKLAKKCGRTLDDPAALGLWMRWRPTARALGRIKAGEYTELSIAFTMESAHNQTGEKRGPALLSVALTNTPFVDTMLPVAASRHDGGTPAASGRGDTAMSTPNTVLLSAAAALAGKAVATEEEAQTVLTAIAPEVVRLRAFEAQIGAELGEIEVGKALTRLKTIKGENAEFRDRAEKAEKARIDGVIEATMKDFEDRITPFARDTIFIPALRGELEKNPALAAKDSQTVKALKDLKPNGITTQRSAGDSGDKLPDDPDQRLEILSKKHLKNDEDLIELAKTDRDRATDLAQDRAAKEMQYKSTQQRRIEEQITA